MEDLLPPVRVSMVPSRLLLYSALPVPIILSTLLGIHALNHLLGHIDLLGAPEIFLLFHLQTILNSNLIFLLNVDRLNKDLGLHLITTGVFRGRAFD